MSHGPSVLADILVKMAVICHLGIFEKLEFLNSRYGLDTNMHQHTKFHKNQPNIDGDIATFFKIIKLDF